MWKGMIADMDLLLCAGLFVLLLAIDYFPGIRTRELRLNIAYGAMVIVSFVGLVIYQLNYSSPALTDLIRSAVAPLMGSE